MLDDFGYHFLRTKRGVMPCEATSDATYVTSEVFLLQLLLMRVADDGIAIKANFGPI